MSGTTVRVRTETHERLKQLAHERGQPLPDVVADAVERLWREELLEATNDAYAALRSHPDGWRLELDEREAWEATLSDGLGDE